MYSVNTLPCNVLITPDEVTRLFSCGIIDPNIWSSAIQIAEERFVRPLLGSALYDAFTAQKNIIVTSGNITQLQAAFDAQWGTNKVGDGPKIELQEGWIVNAIELISVSAANKLLWNNILWKYIYECVYFTALPEVYAQFTNSGVVKNNPNPAFIDGNPSGSSAGIGLRDLKYLKDDVLLQRISVMQDALERFICANISSYPLYPTHKRNAWTDNGEKRAARKTGFIDIYDDECDDYNSVTQSPSVTPAPSYRACSMQLKIVASPNPSNTYTLCNLQTIAQEYPAGNTLTVTHLIGKTIVLPIYIGNNPVSDVVFDMTIGEIDNTINGGFAEGNTVTINYNEIV